MAETADEVKCNIALITGGNLSNKGAQAMTFATVAEVQRRFPELEPVAISSSDAAPHAIERLMGRKPTHDQATFTFPFARGLPAGYLGTAPEQRGFSLKRKAKRLVLRKDYECAERYYRRAAICIDISGFAFGDKWGFRRCESYLSHLEALRSFGIPTYLMPQSFGPFDFDEPRRSNLRRRAGEVLPFVRLAFAREREGLDAMRDLCPEMNIVHSDDLVLQTGALDLNSIFARQPLPSSHLPEPGGGVKWVSVVPNMRTYDHGDVASLDSLYRALVARLVDAGYRVCLVRHSAEDIGICKRVKRMFPDDGRIEVFGEDRYCFEYEELFARCDFLVASRFHSIVHAYRRGVPCVALGWAVKYPELLGLAGQQALAFNVSRAGFDPADVLGAVEYVAAERETLSSAIRAAVARVQERNVFDLVERDFRELAR